MIWHKKTPCWVSRKIHTIPKPSKTRWVPSYKWSYCITPITVPLFATWNHTSSPRCAHQAVSKPSASSRRRRMSSARFSTPSSQWPRCVFCREAVRGWSRSILAFFFAGQVFHCALKKRQIWQVIFCQNSWKKNIKLTGSEFRFIRSEKVLKKHLLVPFFQGKVIFQLPGLFLKLTMAPENGFLENELVCFGGSVAGDFVGKDTKLLRVLHPMLVTIFGPYKHNNWLYLLILNL